MSDLLDNKCTIDKCWICAKYCLYYPPNDKRDFVLAKPDLIKWRLDNCPEPSVSTKAMMLDILKRYSTGEIVESGEQKEKEMMVSIKTVDVEKEREAAREEGYKAGLEEAWEIATKVGLESLDGGYTRKELKSIFGNESWINIFQHMSIHEAKEKIAAYEAEQAKPKLGDVVKCINACNPNCVYIGIVCNIVGDIYSVLCKGDSGVVHLVLHKNIWTIEKTGKHFDIQSMLDEIKE